MSVRAAVRAGPLPFASAVCLTLALLVAGGATARAAEQRVARTIPLPPGTPIRLEATIADVVVEGTTGGDVTLRIVRRAPDEAALARYPVVVDDQGGHLRITTVQSGGGVDPALKTEIHLTMPSDATLERLQVFEGKVRLRNLHGTCNVGLRRGDVEGTAIGGRVRLETELGAIHLRGAELSPGGMMHLRTFNGDVRVRLATMPRDARILAVTYNGRIASDIPLAMKDKFGPHFGETTLGRGEPVLSIDIVKGDIAINVGS